MLRRELSRNESGRDISFWSSFILRSSWWNTIYDKHTKHSKEDSVRGDSCDFVDPSLISGTETIHEITRIHPKPGFYFGWIRKVKLQMPIFSSGWAMVRCSRGISR